MATRTIEVCDVCGRQAKNIQTYVSTLGTKETGAPHQYEARVCQVCAKRAIHFHDKAFQPTNSGKKRLEATA